MGSKTIRNTE